jgi:hypothetical protein
MAAPGREEEALEKTEPLRGGSQGSPHEPVETDASAEAAAAPAEAFDAEAPDVEVVGRPLPALAVEAGGP